ncbi:3,4-dihydroxy-2-butanone-4-phosphate synthase [Nocardia jiangxiensis]|uniref:GTP cyclohydrolase-2 n=1 Tax=Nocardia jiangxiensis TaxID=282685 RepID=A0ABW6RW81_9NOCA
MADSLTAALAALARGEMIVVADDRDRENEGDLVMAAGRMTTEQMAFYLRYGSGIVCVPMSDERADALELEPMIMHNTDSHGTAFTVSTDHSATGTGISAADRVKTVQALADLRTAPRELRRPGHVFPLRAKVGGVLARAGHTEATIDLLDLAGETPVGVITELVGDDGIPLQGRQIVEFAHSHGLVAVTVDDIKRARRHDVGRSITCTARATLPLAGARFTAACYTSALDGVDHMALVLGDIAAADARDEGVLVRVHSECLTGDVFGSRRCDCGDQLQQAIELIVAEGAGIIIYLRGHEGRGIGLSHKLQAYALQEDGFDTVDANTELGLPVDSREYGVAAVVLADLGVRNLRLITNNPQKYAELSGFDLRLSGRVQTEVVVTPDNLRYLRTKRDRMGHELDLRMWEAQA